MVCVGKLHKIDIQIRFYLIRLFFIDNNLLILNLVHDKNVKVLKILNHQTSKDSKTFKVLNPGLINRISGFCWMPKFLIHIIRSYETSIKNL